MVLGGVFERHPGLKMVFTELGTSNWVFDTVARLEGFTLGAVIVRTIPSLFAGEAGRKLSLRPNEYVRRHGYFGATASRTDLEQRHDRPPRRATEWRPPRPWEVAGALRRSRPPLEYGLFLEPVISPVRRETRPGPPPKAMLTPCRLGQPVHPIPLVRPW